VATLLLAVSCTPGRKAPLADRDGGAASAASAPDRGAGGGLDFFREMRPDEARKHVHFMHLDGWRADLFQQLLDRGQLPHFALLLARGRVSTRASTVDKSETMKVIESYLTSRRDTFIAGWWQYNRDRFQFKNYWLDPIEVINYELGLEFPQNPSVFDYLTSHGARVTSGFGLHRRSVAYRDYTRNYVEGAAAVFHHTYYDQLDATTVSIRALYEKIGRDAAETIPALSTSLLAAADENAHLNGVVNPHTPVAGRAPDDHCLRRKPGRADRAADRFERIFAMVEGDGAARTVFSGRTLVDGAVREAAGAGHFSRVSPDEICFRLPRLTVAAAPAPGPDPTTGPHEEAFADPSYVLGMLAIDIELGRLINTLRGVRFDCPGGAHCFEPAAGNGIEAYLRGGRAENSLFEKTLFVFTGDHGMVDTRYMMARETPELRELGRHAGSMPVDFIEALDRDLGLTAPRKDEAIAPGAEIGIDDAHLPRRLVYPHKDSSWQSPAVQATVKEATAWSAAFFKDVERSLKNSLHRRYWWLLFLRQPIVDSQVNARVEPYERAVLDTLTQLYLAGEPGYLDALRAADRAFYARHVRLIYGGGARNNAELFLPSRTADGPSWASRPSREQILGDDRLLRSLRGNPGVGLIFLRQGNEQIDPASPLPASMAITVLDRFGHEGTITVQRDLPTGELLYGYQAQTPVDPLDYGEFGRAPGQLRTYNEWNDISVRRSDYFHNAVAGMGSYLYSTNPAIGDLTLMHSQGWDFGDNSGGHGGLHREEKITLMLVSGPGIRSGELMATARYRSVLAPDGTVKVEAGNTLTFPTVVDAAPTILAWLGHGEGALTAHARSPAFAAQLRAWNTAQQAGYPEDFYQILSGALHQLAPDIQLDPTVIKPRLGRLFRFMARQEVRLPASAAETHEDGNQLRLDEGPAPAPP
jgi:hypothetical protein